MYLTYKWYSKNDIHQNSKLWKKHFSTHFIHDNVETETTTLPSWYPVPFLVDLSRSVIEIIYLFPHTCILISTPHDLDYSQLYISTSVSVLTFSGCSLFTFLILSLTLVTWSFSSFMQVSAWPMSQCFSVVIILQSLLFILSFSFLFAFSVAYTAYVPCTFPTHATQSLPLGQPTVQPGHCAGRKT